MSGIMAAKTLSEKGVKDFVILEATNRIGGRMYKESIAGYTVEKGANWVEGVGGPKMNPIWPLANKYKMRSFLSDWNNLSYNIYGQEGGILPQSVVARPYKLASLSSDFSSNLSTLLQKSGGEDISILASQRTFGHVPITPLEMAIDFFMYDFEIAEPPRVTSLKNVEPNPTFEEFGENEYFIADSRGYEFIVHKIAQEFLHSANGSISDPRLKLNKVVREIEYTEKGVKVSTEDGSVYTAKNAIVSVSVGVLQTKLIDFKPDLPLWKLMAIYKWDMVIYCKIFMKFPFKFWPTGPGTEFFMYAHEKRGYYNFWQHLENEYPGGNLLMVTVTDDESRRIEQQPDHETKAEIMSVLRKMFGYHIPEMEEILIPRWGQDRFYKGTYSNWPIGVSVHDFESLQAPVGPVYFTGEHTSQEYNGYVHGAYLAGIDTANQLLDCIKKGHCATKSHQQNETCNADIQREMEMERTAWMGKVQVLENALSQKCKP
ncbi:hypothetical protein SUGI_0737610 [Cryptomeria japonica]|nr:hypothetical protein SUGI_0737610 [Cryptomeria japonica]